MLFVHPYQRFLIQLKSLDSHVSSTNQHTLKPHNLELHYLKNKLL